MKLSVCRAIESGVTDGSAIFVSASSHNHCPLILGLVEEYKMDWHDCLKVALMKKYGVEEVYSNDRHFDKVEGVKRIFT